LRQGLLQKEVQATVGLGRALRTSKEHCRHPVIAVKQLPTRMKLQSAQLTPQACMNQAMDQHSKFQALFTASSCVIIIVT
jgi:hypothetical protein